MEDPTYYSNPVVGEVTHLFFKFQHSNSQINIREENYRPDKLLVTFGCYGNDFVGCRSSVNDGKGTYVEIYVKASMETLRFRNQKNLYSSNNFDVAGVHFDVEEPKNPDIILNNDGVMTLEEQVNILKRYIDGVMV